MSLANLEKAFQLMENEFTEDEKDMGSGRSLETIDNAERFLNIRFPTTYRKFLETYGHGGVGSLEIYGLKKEDDFKTPDTSIDWSSNIVWRTFHEHQKYKHPLHILILYELGEGTKYCLDLSQMKGDECPVVVWPIWGYEGNPRLEILAQNFGDFLLEMVEEEITYKKEEEEENQ